ncbi:hypothetical protein ILUMI_02791 [Ignelater luminosus]|uniref:Uncharacterized protein n=1 Tax=Ignelater luminosus TaxID=2038154 RepID=A0A8K0GG50_IGNLU|nr:hypothetical protein ILUMI_02791 [Ignelater luminosus]
MNSNGGLFNPPLQFYTTCGLLHKFGVKTEELLSFRNGQRKDRFPNRDFDYDNLSRHVHRVVDRFRRTGTFDKGKSSGRTTVLTEHALEDVRTHMKHSPKKSCKQQTDVDVSLGYLNTCTVESCSEDSTTIKYKLANISVVYKPADSKTRELSAVILQNFNNFYKKPQYSNFELSNVIHVVLASASAFVRLLQLL